MMIGFFAKWKDWGLPAFAAAITPWQEKLTNIQLISEWFQPGLNTLASLIGPLACLVTFAVLNPKSRRKQARFAVWSALVFLVCLLTCFALNYSVGLLWIPTPLEQLFVRLIWVGVYLTLFITLALSIVGATLAIPDERNPAPTSNRH